MTIKKRLFISNILMITIPYFVSMITISSSIFILNRFTDNEYSRLFIGRNFASTHDSTPSFYAILLALLVLVFFFAVMILTNRFLTKFVFKRINQPLEMLIEGVEHLSNGDLNHRINYTGQDEFKPVCDAFNNMAAELKMSNETVQKNEQNRKELFAGISHDIRSPLTSIKAFTDGLLDGVASTPEAQKEYLLTIKQKTEDINSMISQLFSYSKIDMGNYPINPEKLDINKEITDFVTASQEEYRAKGLLLKISGTAPQTFIFADPLYLRSVFANILDNSAKYKKNETVQATICCTVSKNFVNIVFDDNGPGVSENALPKLFDAFYRADPSRSNPNQGSGLGLAIVAKALERMGGSISAENIKKGGLRIIVKIPTMKEVDA